MLCIITLGILLLRIVPVSAENGSVLSLRAEDTRLRIRVSSAQELLDNLGSDRILLLAEGEYFLSDVNTDSIFIRRDAVHDGFSLTIKNIKNLSIVGEGEQGAMLLVLPRYAYVLNFEQCQDISLINLTLGHTLEQGTCSNGVLGFHDCTDILIRNCDLFGSGTEGLVLSEVTRFQFDRSRIRECTYGILSIYNSLHVTFSESTFTHNSGWYWGVRLKNVDTVEFSSCTFAHNTIAAPLVDVDTSSGVTFTQCRLHSNVFDVLSNDVTVVQSLVSFTGQFPSDFTPTPSQVASEFPIERIDDYEVIQTGNEYFVYIRSISQISTYTREWEDPPQSGKVAVYVNGFYRMNDGVFTPIWEAYGSGGYEDHLIEADFWCAGDCVSIEAIRTYYLDHLFCVENTWTYYRDYDTTLLCANTSNPDHQVLMNHEGQLFVSLEENGVIRVEYSCFMKATFGEYQIGQNTPDSCTEGYGQQCFVYDSASSLYHETSCPERQQE